MAKGVEENDETRKALLDYAAEHLARFKVPRTVDFTTDMPRSAAGKLMKKILMARYTG